MRPGADRASPSRRPGDATTRVTEAATALPALAWQHRALSDDQLLEYVGRARPGDSRSMEGGFGGLARTSAGFLLKLYASKCHLREGDRHAVTA